MRKKLLIYFAFVVGILLYCGNVYALDTADIFLNNTQVPTTTYITSNSGTNTFHLSLLAYDSTDEYFQFTFCSDVIDVTDWTSAGTGNNVYIISSNASCRYPNSSYTGGKIVYIYGSTNWNSMQNCSVQGFNCFNDIYFSYWQSNTLVSWTLLNSSLSSSPFEFDYATNSLINNSNINTQNIINNNNTNAQATINTITDSTSQSQQELTGFLASWNNLLPTNGVVSNLFLLPINFLNAFIGNFNITCQPFNLGNLYGHNITFPCIDIHSIVGDSLYTAIDLLFSGLMIFTMIKKLILIWYEITSFKANAIYELYGGGR